MLLFANRRNDAQVQGFLLKLANNNCSEMERQIEGPRLEGRVRMTIVVLITPIISKRFHVEKTFAAVTKELSTSGVSLVLNSPRALDEVVLGFRWENDMKFARAKAKHLNPLGAGFYQLGLRVTDVLCNADHPELKELRF